MQSCLEFCCVELSSRSLPVAKVTLLVQLSDLTIYPCHTPARRQFFGYAISSINDDIWHDGLIHKRHFIMSNTSKLNVLHASSRFRHLFSEVSSLV